VYWNTYAHAHSDSSSNDIDANGALTPTGIDIASAFYVRAVRGGS
jgi:hypothetical protein